MAVKGTRNLTVEYILDRVDSYQAYLLYCPVPFTPNKPFCSPFRKETSPSFIIGNKYGHFTHYDFGDSRYKGGFIEFVMQKFNCTVGDAIRIIAKDFGLGNYELSGDKVILADPPKIVPPKQSLIQVVTKPFDKSDLTYWGDYYQTKDDLIREKVYSVKSLWVNRSKINILPTELVFAYEWEDGKYWKIYRPFAKNKKFKWVSNTPNDLVDGLENIKGCDKALITKSKKDAMVIRKFFACTCGVQNESLGAINSFTQEWLNREAKEIYVNYDGDEPGKHNSNIVTSTFGWKHINVPDNYVKEGIKDFADLAKYKGLDVVIEYFKSKNLI